VRQARARDEIVRLVHRTTGVHRLARDMTRILKRAVPFDGVGLMTVDPATLLPTSEVADARLGVSDGVVLETWPRFIEIELREPDFNKFHAWRGRVVAPPVSAMRLKAIFNRAFAIASSADRLVSATRCA